MSHWTHFCGGLRIDGICLEEEDKEEYHSWAKETISQVLGKIITWEDLLNGKSGETSLPNGSEGSLQYEILCNSEINDMAQFNVVIFGDLRDFGKSPEDISQAKEWFTKVCNRFDLEDFSKGGMFLNGIRGGVLEISPENGKECIVCSTGEVFEYQL